MHEGRSKELCLQHKEVRFQSLETDSLPWLVSNAGVIITREKKVLDGKTEYQKIKSKSPSNKMMPFGERVVWMMPKDLHLRNKLEPLHPNWSIRWDIAEDRRICCLGARRSSTCSHSFTDFLKMRDGTPTSKSSER